MKERAWNIEYEYDRSAKKLANVYWSGAEITPLLWRYLHPSVITITEAFNRLSKKIELNPMVELICLLNSYNERR
ncbi:MAG TPA: hypothetical protein VHH33_02315 [Nitrososphaeraceae archaeon]|nr:hypothetical protein [Nitrososphaeraceae archaeon]